MATTVPWDNARVIGINREPPAAAVEHLKAAIDHWVRNVGVEQDQRGSVQVLSVAPGTVDTTFQQRLRDTPDADFPRRQKFLDLYDQGNLSDPQDVAGQIWALIS